MKTIIHTSASRGYADHAWLKSWHTFSFADYFDRSRMNFGVLRVLNDDIVGKDNGFGMHPHQNMEILTVVLKGAISHSDSYGNEGIIHPDEVQVMSAGTGIYHSEMNKSQNEDCHLLQLWFLPAQQNLKPRYEQHRVDKEQRQDKIHTFVSPFGQGGILSLHQEVWVSRLDATEGKSFTYQMHDKNNGLYIFVIEGSIKTAGITLNRRDAAGITESSKADIKALKNSEIIMFEVKMI